MRTLAVAMLVFGCAPALEAAEGEQKWRRAASSARRVSASPPQNLIRPVSFLSAWPTEWLDGERHSDAANGQSESEDDEKPKRSFGPPPQESRKTLMQWSYGTSFDGGIDLDKEPLQTDRPDFTEASTTVGKGVLQIETGYTFTRNKDSDDDTANHSWGEPLLRYGIFADWLEFRIAFFPHNQSTAAGPGPHEKVSGLEDIYLGFKIALTPQEGWWPEMALTPQMTVPTANKAVTHDRTLPGVNWLYGWDVNDFLAIGGSTQFNRAIDDDTGKTYTEWAQSMTLNYTLTEELGAFTEWFAFFPAGADTEPIQHYIDGGFTYKLTNDMQVDVRAGYGLSGRANDYFIGSGLSLRFK